MNKGFPVSFKWGAAASSFQIEGAAHLEDRGQSVWDTFCQKQGTIKNGDTAFTACDHCRLVEDDVRLMSEIGLDAYRFSISWPRVLPEGRGTVNTKGLAFYDQLIDSLLAADIEPWATLFHWDFPEALFQQGGWLNRDSASWFADYVAAMVGHFSDRVSHWITLNEPQCFLQLGHSEGIHAPGLNLTSPEMIEAAHHVLLAHGKGVSAIREFSVLDPVIGIAPIGDIKIPASQNEADIEAARTATMSRSSESLWDNVWFCDPILLGKYSLGWLEEHQDSPSEKRAEKRAEQRMEDLAIIHQPIDFVGLNIYSATSVREASDGQIVEVPFPAGGPRTAFGWTIVPESLYWGPKFFHDRYELPIVIAENGMSSTDWVARDGRVHDPQRIDFLGRYLGALQQVVDEGVSVLGYFHWSLMDNFEWAEGFSQRFGLIHVDFETQRRTLKDSAYWYQEVIRTRGSSLFSQTPALITESATVG